MNFDQVIVEAMADENYYQKPKQEQKKPNTISAGVSAIIKTSRRRNGGSEEKNYSNENHDHPKDHRSSGDVGR